MCARNGVDVYKDSCFMASPNHSLKELVDLSTYAVFTVPKVALMSNVPLTPRSERHCVYPDIHLSIRYNVQHLCAPLIGPRQRWVPKHTTVTCGSRFFSRTEISYAS